MNIREALAKGELLESIKVEGNQATLILKEVFNKKSYYSSINHALLMLWDSSKDFQTKFIKPKYSKKAPVLLLNEDQKGIDHSELLKLLKNYASQAKPIIFKKALARGELVIGVKRKGSTFSFVLSDEWASQGHVAINGALANLYKSSIILQELFTTPTTGIHTPYLTCRKDIEKQLTETEVFETLIKAAAPKKLFKPKELLAQGKLLDGIERRENQVKLILKKQFNQIENYKSINSALYALYTSSKSFQEKFEQPKLSGLLFPLTLKPNHGYLNNDEILKALRDFCEIKKVNIRDKINEGKVFHSVELKGNQVKLILNDEFNTEKPIISINNTLKVLWDTSAIFKSQFERPKQGKVLSLLTLHEGHQYKNSDAVYEALKQMMKRARKINAKEALATGKLIDKLTLQGGKVNLVLKAPYQDPQYYRCINASLLGMYKASSEFQDKFTQPTTGVHNPFLVLKEEFRDYKEDEILAILMASATSKNRFNIKKLLAEGKLIERLEMNGDEVKIILQTQYNNPFRYHPINMLLCNLYRRYSHLQTKFLKPKSNCNKPMLILKPDHGYLSEQAVLDDLINCAQTRFMTKGKLIEHVKLTPLNPRRLLAENKLIEKLELKGIEVTIHLKKTYNKEKYFHSINSALYNLFKTSDPFKDKFKRPKTGYHQPFLIVKPEQFSNPQEMLDALKEYASPKIPNKQLLVKKAITRNKLFDKIELQNNCVTLSLNKEFDSPRGFAAVNQSLNKLYKGSPLFQSKFKKPSIEVDRPCLFLKKEHDCKKSEDVLNLLRLICESGSKREPPIAFDVLEHFSDLIQNLNEFQEFEAETVSELLSAPTVPPLRFSKNELVESQEIKEHNKYNYDLRMDEPSSLSYG